MNSELKAKLNDMFPRGGVKAMSESQVDVMSAVLAAQTMWSDILVEKPSFKVSASNTFVDEAYNFVFGIDTNNADFVKNIRTEVSRHEKLNNTSRRIALSFMSTDKDFELMKKRFPAYYTDTYVKANPKDVLTGKSKIELAIGRCTDAAKIADAHHTSFSQSGYDMEINGNYKKMFEKSIDAKAFGFQPLHYLALALDEKTLKPFTAGFATVITDGDWAYLTHLGTNPDLRGKGVAGELVPHVSRELKAMGVQKIVAETRSGTFIEDFYRKIGFTNDAFTHYVTSVLAKEEK